MNHKQLERWSRLMPDNKPKYVRIYDAADGGQADDWPADRYTVVFSGNYNNLGHAGRDTVGTTLHSHPYIGMSSQPFHPQGYCQHGESEFYCIDRLPEDHWPPVIGRKHPRLGRRIDYDELPEDCREVVLRDYLELWMLPSMTCDVCGRTAMGTSTHCRKHPPEGFQPCPTCPRFFASSSDSDQCMYCRPSYHQDQYEPMDQYVTVYAVIYMDEGKPRAASKLYAKCEEAEKRAIGINIGRMPQVTEYMLNVRILREQFPDEHTYALLCELGVAQFDVKGKDVRVYEAQNGFYVEHLFTGAVRGCGDMVGQYTDEGSSESLAVGTADFYYALANDVLYHEAQWVEAYFQKEEVTG